MRLTKSQSIVLALGILALFFTVGIGFMKSRSTPTRISLKPKAEEKREVTQSIGDIDFDYSSEKGSSVVLGKFERAESSADGRPLWEIKADTGKYYPQSSKADVDDAIMKFYKKGGKTILLKTKKADITLEGNGLKSAHAYGGVVLNLNDKTTIKTEEANYDKISGNIITTKRVDIFHEMMETTGYGLEGNIPKQEFVLLKNVNSVIKPKKK